MNYCDLSESVEVMQTNSIQLVFCLQQYQLISPSISRQDDNSITREEGWTNEEDDNQFMITSHAELPHRNIFTNNRTLLPVTTDNQLVPLGRLLVVSLSSYPLTRQSEVSLCELGCSFSFNLTCCQRLYNSAYE